MSELDDPEPQPPTRYDAWAYVIIGLLGLPLLAIGAGALVLPPGIAFALIRRGLAEHRPSWLVLGVLTALLWLVFLYAAGRRVMGRRRPGAGGATINPDGRSQAPGADHGKPQDFRG